MFGKFRFHESFIACGLENFKGSMNGNHLKLPPTISEGSEEMNSNPYQQRPNRTTSGSTRRHANHHRRPLRTLQQLENSLDVPSTPTNFNRVNPVELSLDTKMGENIAEMSGGGTFFLDGEAERRKLFNDDMINGDQVEGVVDDDVDDVVRQEQDQFRFNDPTSQSLQRRFNNSNNHSNTNLRTKNDTISGWFDTSLVGIWTP